MANLQIKGIDKDFYARLKEVSSAENRSVSQQVLFLIKNYLVKKSQIQNAKTPAQVLLELSGSWQDSRSSEQIIKELKKSRKSSKKLVEGF